MLIPCPECNKQISDKAISCPNCGYPINVTPTAVKSVLGANTGFKREHRRLPNGFGQIRKLSGNRRKPYMVMPPLKKEDYDDNGKPKQQKPLGYFASWYDAYDFLAEYNKGDKGITFEKVYELWYAEKFENPLKQLSASTLGSYKTAYNHLSEIHNMPFKQIRASDMQKQIDNISIISTAIAGKCCDIFRGLFNYAIKEGIVDKNYCDFITRPTVIVESGEPFTEKEIKSLWEHSDDRYVQIMLILIYSGLRINELKTAQIDLENQIFIGGNKTENGKNRIVPIHPFIIKFVEDFDQNNFSPPNYRRTNLLKVKMLCGMIDEYGMKHTPHDARHTFSWLADKSKMDDLSKHLIMGHSLKKFGVEGEVYGHRTIEELTAEMHKIDFKG